MNKYIYGYIIIKRTHGTIKNILSNSEYISHIIRYMYTHYDYVSWFSENPFRFILYYIIRRFILGISFYPRIMFRIYVYVLLCIIIYFRETKKKNPHNIIIIIIYTLIHITSTPETIYIYILYRQTKEGCHYITRMFYVCSVFKKQ